MTIAQLEERLTVLEKVVERLQTQIPITSPASDPSAREEKKETAEDLIPGTEYDLVITVPPKETIHLWGHIVSIQRGSSELGLSDTEWASLGLENEDE